MNFNIKHHFPRALSVLLVCAIPACTPESSNDELGPLATASFTATPMEGNPNKIIVSSTTKGGFLWLWNYGAKGVARRETDTLRLPKQGEHTIQLTVFTKGGYSTTAQKVTIPRDAPTIDILKGGDMEAGSEAHWTLLNTGGTQTAITIEGGVMKFSNTGDSNGAIYQAVEVIADREYTFSGIVKGNGAQNTWFEVYYGTKEPVQGADYTGTKFIALNTWSGCGTIPFDGDLVEIGCDGDGKNKEGKYVFETSGTVYIVIKAGSSGGTLGTGGITIDNVRFLEEQ